MKSYASVSKELISELFGEENVDCYITHIDVYNDDIFTIVILGDKQLIARFDKELKLINHHFIDDTELRVTALRVMSSGIVCTGLVGNEASYEFNTFVLFKFNFDLELINTHEYDILYTRHNPQIVETPSGDIVCSGIKLAMAKHVVHTFCIRFAADLTMLNSIIYDTNEVVHITRLITLEDNSVIGVGYKHILNRKTYIFAEAATALLFQVSNISGFITQENIWIDRSPGNTHINDAILVDQNTFMCVGYSKLIGSQNAAIWKFNIIDGKIIRCGIKYYRDVSSNVLYTKITQSDSEIMILGRVYDADANETFIIASVDQGLCCITSIRIALFKACEEMYNMLFNKNIVYCIGAEERIMDNVCSGIIKRIIFSKDAVQ